jgi:hypothetical protein
VKIVLDDGSERALSPLKNDDNQQIKTFRFHIPKKTKKIKFNIEPKKSIPTGQAGEGNIPWTFIDEIQVIR